MIEDPRLIAEFCAALILLLLAVLNLMRVQRARSDTPDEMSIESELAQLRMLEEGMEKSAKVLGSVYDSVSPAAAPGVLFLRAICDAYKEWMDAARQVSASGRDEFKRHMGRLQEAVRSCPDGSLPGDAVVWVDEALVHSVKLLDRDLDPDHRKVNLQNAYRKLLDRAEVELIRPSRGDTYTDRERNISVRVDHVYTRGLRTRDGQIVLCEPEIRELR